MENAEEIAEDAQGEASPNFKYYNAKCLQSEEEPCGNDSLKADLYANSHFWNLEVNTSFSAVHVPTNVYDKGSC